MPDIAIMILAAGGSTRMGEPKQLLAYRGRSLIRHAAETAVASGCRPAIVVLGAHADRLAAEVSGLAVSVAINERWASGIGSSIRCGIEHLMAVTPTVEAVVITLCDQPLVSAGILRHLIDAHQSSGKPICASSYRGTLGPPVLVSRRFFPQLLALPDDQGAKRLWVDQPEQVCEVPCEPAAEDIDTPEDYRRVCGGGNAER
ncbi:MAG: 4-diphosphocytidyl-2C-methyl-D-erythritol synthase [Phycisphaerales bacterium]|nr:4-diphosphocytidyl-2C-methyl-D-erythritol synthase [Phycisphaerales bacterium]